MLFVVVCNICLTLNASYPQFNHCNVVRNFYLSTRSSELLANVDVLKDMLVFRDHPNQCTGLFETAEIAIAIKCRPICTA